MVGSGATQLNDSSIGLVGGVVVGAVVVGAVVVGAGAGQAVVSNIDANITTNTQTIPRNDNNFIFFIG